MKQGFFFLILLFFSNLLAKKLKTEQILLEGPIINPKEEISGMDWYKEHLFLLPENQNNYLYVIPKEKIYKSLESSKKIKILPKKNNFIAPDYKRSIDLTCSQYEPVKCDTFITEATFGLPIFNHPNDKDEVKKLIDSLNTNNHSTHLVGVYALGKCQRLISLLRNLGYEKTIYLHGALMKISEYYSKIGINLGKIEKVSEKSPSQLINSLVLCPPSSLNDKWSQKFLNKIKGYVSGWMKIKQRIKQKNIELPLVISDHSDWKDILKTVEDVSPSEVLVTHGREEALVHYLNSKNYHSSALNLIGFEDDNE